MKNKLILPLILTLILSSLGYAMTWSGVTDPLPYLRTTNISVSLVQNGTMNCTFGFEGGTILVTNTTMKIVSENETGLVYWFMYNPEVNGSDRGCGKTITASCTNESTGTNHTVSGTSSTFCLWGYYMDDVDDIAVDVGSNFFVSFIAYMALIALVIVIVFLVVKYRKAGGKTKW